MTSHGTVVIRSSDGTAELRLSDREALAGVPGAIYFRATLSKTDALGTHTRVSASTKIPAACDPRGELPHFFDSMAAARTGWEGEQRCESVGAILTLRSKLYAYPASGHGEETMVTMEAVLKSALEDWWVSAVLSLEPGQLEGIAEQVRQFFSAPAAP